MPDSKVLTCASNRVRAYVGDIDVHLVSDGTTQTLLVGPHLVAKRSMNGSWRVFDLAKVRYLGIQHTQCRACDVRLRTTGGMERHKKSPAHLERLGTWVFSFLEQLPPVTE